MEGDNHDLLSIWATPEAEADLVRLTSWTQSAAKRRSVIQSAGIPKDGRGNRVVTQSSMVRGLSEARKEIVKLVLDLGPVLGMGGKSDG